MTTITLPRATVEQALEALNGLSEDAVCQSSHHAKRDRHTSLDVCPVFLRLRAAVAALRAALAASVPHGCHVDLDPGMKPDGCVLDENRPEKCVYARRLVREGKDKTACEYWQPIEVMR